MRELITCWQHTRMLVLMGVCAALYVAILVPFKIAVIVPGITEIRPAAALPVVFSVFFGPAAAWGSAFGNIIGDVLGGTIGIGSLFGFIGNFVYAFVPYRILRTYSPSHERIWSAKGWLTLFFAILIASALCALIIALGVELIGYPYEVVVHAIFLNNVIVSVVLAPLLIRTLARRIVQMKLTYEQLLDERDISRSVLRLAGAIILVAVIATIYIIRMDPSWVERVFPSRAAFNLVADGILFLAALLLL